MIKYLVTIETETPLNINSGLQIGGYVNNLTVKDINNKPYIPGTTIKGKIRDNYRMINGQAKSDEIFGSGLGNNQSKIFVDNFYLKENEYNSSVRFGNAINRFLKIANNGALYSKETIMAKFIGEIEINNTDENEIEDIILAIKMIKTIGGGKSRGLGKVELNLEKL